MFCLSGIGSELSCDVFPSIDLSDGEWEIGLVDFTTYNSIPNVEEGKNNLFHYGDMTVKIPTGSYEINDLKDCIQKQTSEEVEIIGNTNTFKVEIFGRKEIDFTDSQSIGSLMGFTARKLKPNKWHVSDKTVDIIKVNVIRITCNVARGSYKNGLEGHIIHEFYPSVPPGFKIIETPHNVIYLPVNIKRLEHLSLSICDQDGNLINLREEPVNIKLHLRRSNGSGLQQ